MNVPDDLRYDVDQHIWVNVDDNMATIGITDYAQDQMGDILYIELAELDEEYDRGDEFSSVESGKKIAALEAPFAFEVVEVNESLEDDPEAVNEDPYGSWIVKVVITDDEGMEDLVDDVAYKNAIS